MTIAQNGSRAIGSSSRIQFARAVPHRNVGSCRRRAPTTLSGGCTCPLIPFIMYPAANSSVLAVVVVATVFGLVTITTMLACVMAAYFGLSRFAFPQAERYSHALAGLTILLCGGAIKFLGL